MSTETLTVERLDPIDLPRARELLRLCGLPVAGVGDPGLTLFAARSGQRIVGLAGLEARGEEGLLRSVATDPMWRNRGVARFLWDAVRIEAERLGVRRVWLLTETARTYFERLGFQIVARETAPASIRETEEFRGVCPESATCMRLELA